jgi:hypothetical protein
MMKPMKFKYLYLFLASVLLAACSLSPEPDTAAGSDGALVRTIVPQTLSQQANAQPDDTPQPAQQEAVDEAPGDGALGGNVSGGDVLGGNVSGGDVSGGDVLGGNVSGDDVSGDDVSAGDVSGSDVSGDDVSGDGASGDDAVPPDPVDPNQGIPGLNASDLVDRLFEFGFDCSAPEIQGEHHIRYCNFETSEYQFSVTIWGSTPDTVDLIEAAAFYFGDLDYSGLTSIVFEMIAEVPYDGADPESAGAWLEATIPEIQNIGDEALTDFGGVRYYLYAFPSAHMFEIGRLLE